MNTGFCRGTILSCPSHVRQAGNFALELCELVQQTNWLIKGLPKDLNLRIALHAGPVHRQVNPITGHTHVSHTARIEPITPPGKVYASQAFAAICDQALLASLSLLLKG